MFLKCAQHRLVRLVREVYGSEFDPVLAFSGVVVLACGIYGLKLIMPTVVGREASILGVLVSLTYAFGLLAIFVLAALAGIVTLIRECLLWTHGRR
jgi:hypothetical protein